MRTLFHAFLMMLVALPACAAGKTELTWYGQAAFRLVTPAGKVIFIDPWLTNPKNPNGKADLDAVSRADLILITHGHFDHVGDSVTIAKKTGAKLVATADFGKNLAIHGGFPAAQAGLATMGNFGGKLDLLDGEVEIAFVPAVHSSSVTSGSGQDIHDGGAPGGFWIRIKDGPTLYHTGDTDVFADMALIPRFGQVDMMLACIGGHFTMGPERAALAVKLVGPKEVMPMHFGTFPLLKGNPEEFAAALKKEGVNARLRVMNIGETCTW